MKKIGNRIIVMTSLLLTVSIGCRKRTSEAPSVPEVEVAEVYTDSVVTYKNYPGVLTSKEISEVVAKVTGEIISKEYVPGSYVTKGSILFRIDPRTYRDAVIQVESQLNSSRSDYDYYRAQYEAMSRAYVSNAVSRMEVEGARSNMEKAAYSISENEAALRTAQKKLNDCTVRAPISGYITDSDLDVGNYVSGGTAAVKLAMIYDNEELEATFTLSDTEFEEVTREMSREKSLYARIPLEFREQLRGDYSIKLIYESPTVDTTTGTILMKGTVRNPEKELKNGMYVKISLPSWSDPKAMLVKDASISSDESGSYMYLVNDSNKVVKRPVILGDLYQDSLRVVKSGVHPGMRYVTKALLRVQSGERVRPIQTK